AAGKAPVLGPEGAVHYHEGQRHVEQDPERGNDGLEVVVGDLEQQAPPAPGQGQNTQYDQVDLRPDKRPDALGLPAALGGNDELLELAPEDGAQGAADLRPEVDHAKKLAVQE